MKKDNPTPTQMVHARISDQVREQAEKRAVELGFIKPSGPNLSEYIRHLIINDLKKSKK